MKPSFKTLGFSIKDIRSQGEGGCPVRTFCGQGDSSDVDVRTVWRKNNGFFEIYDVSTWTWRRGGEPVANRGGVNFSRFCADILYEWPLTEIKCLQIFYQLFF